MAHIQHLIEDRDITLGTIADIARSVAAGDIPHATEKLDGVNIVFTCTPRYEARFARSESDIRAGGMIRAVLEAKYTGRGLVQETFVEGSKTIAMALRHLAPLEIRKVFDDGKLWYSAEIIYLKNPNVVLYVSNAIVFHERPVLRFDGAKITRELDPPFSSLVADSLSMDVMAQSSGWRVHGPQPVILKPLEDTVWLREVYDAVKEYGSDDMTLRDVLRDRARVQLATLGLTGRTLSDAVERLVKAPGCPSLTVLKPKLPTKAVPMLRDSDAWAANELHHLDMTISRFASVILKDVQSGLVADHVAETARINERLTRSIKLIRDSRNPDAIAILNKQFQKLTHVTPVEGIVFPWNDKLYKLTGSFAPANAIMGLVKYGRGKSVPSLEPM